MRRSNSGNILSFGGVRWSWDVPGERSVVSAASYEARKFGIRSAMPSVKAARLCPDVIFVPGNMELYRSVSAQIHRIFHEYTDLVEPLALDEAFLDVTDNKAGLSLGVEVARRIKQRIRRELGLVASAGVSYNKFFGKDRVGFPETRRALYDSSRPCAGFY